MIENPAQGVDKWRHLSEVTQINIAEKEVERSFLNIEFSRESRGFCGIPSWVSLRTIAHVNDIHTQENIHFQ